MSKVKQINGLELQTVEGPFEDVLILQKALSDALLKRGLDFSSEVHINTEDPLQTEIADKNTEILIKMALSVGTEKPVRNALFALGARCTIIKDGGSKKVDPAFFEVPENRKHYFPIMIEVAKVNLLPFFEGLNLKSLILGALDEKGPQ